MISSRFVSLVFVALVSIACDSTPRPSPFPSPPPPTNPRPFDARQINLLGSYEMVFDDVGLDARSPAPPAPLPATPVSVARTARLDVRAGDEHAYDVNVAITPRWGARRRLIHRHSLETALIVDHEHDPVVIASADETDHWRRFEFPRKSDGSIDGAFAATGTVETSVDGRKTTYPVTARGRVVPDTSRPEMRLDPPLRSRGGEWLPWDPITILVAEPVAANKLFDRISPSFSELRFERGSPADDKGREEITVLQGIFRGVYPKGTRAFGVTDLKDPSGNLFIATNATVTYRALGTPRSKHVFAADDDVALWGSAARIAGPRCETASCILLAPKTQGTCDVPSGVAGFLATAATNPHGVYARVRIFAKGEGAEPPALVTRLRFEVAKGSTIFDATLATLSLSPSGDEELPWSTDWMTMSLGAPQQAEPFGFALTWSDCDAAPNGTTVPPTKLAAVVDQVWAE